MKYSIVAALALSVIAPVQAAAAAPHTAHKGPAPIRYPANHGLPVQLLSAADITARAQKAGGTVTGNVLKTYGGFLGSGPMIRRVDTDPLRDVYVVTSSFPNGLKSRHGRWTAATVTTVYDAQSGSVLQFSITGTLAETYAPGPR